MTEFSEDAEKEGIVNECHFESADFISFPAADNISSYTSLIRWNISKALEENPHLDLKEALKVTKSKLQVSPSVRFSRQLCPEGYYLTCALLAWQNLGQDNPEQLFEYITHNTLSWQDNNSIQNYLNQKKDYLNIPFKKKSSILGSTNFVPSRPTVVMRYESSSKQSFAKKQDDKKTPPSTKTSDEACCKEPGCAERLAAMDNTTTGLRLRAEQLAKREAERIELLERAEVAWKELERGYQRRMKLAGEKEYCMTVQIEKQLEERNADKEACKPLAQKFKEDEQALQRDRQKLAELEKQIRDRMSMRRKLFDETTKEDTSLAEQQIKACQIDRDYQAWLEIKFKEQQALRKLKTLKNEIECVKMLRIETERAMRLDMAEVKQQAQAVSKLLLEQDEKIENLKLEVYNLMKTKEVISDQVEGRKAKCDASLKATMDELVKKREDLQKLKDQVFECRCKVPIDVSVEVKRTPSIAVMCHCSPEDKLDSARISCSCTSLRSTLMSNLLSDLFDGLRSEMGVGLNMPCQLLKCLEDNHNWDHHSSSAIKDRLMDFFSNLLAKELNIAIATSIEKYHAKWVGATCADTARLLKESRENERELSDAQQRMQAHDIEMRAQELAVKLAEEMYKQRTGKMIVERYETEHPKPEAPSCNCSTSKKKDQIYQCIIDQKPKPEKKESKTRKNILLSKKNDVMTTYWFETHKHVSQLRSEIENLKKDSIKRDDLKTMENKISRIIQKAALMEHSTKSPKEKTADDKNDNLKVTNQELLQNNLSSKPQKSRLNRNTISNSMRSKKLLTGMKAPPIIKKSKHMNKFNLNKENILNAIKSETSLFQRVINPDYSLNVPETELSYNSKLKLDLKNTYENNNLTYCINKETIVSETKEKEKDQNPNENLNAKKPSEEIDYVDTELTTLIDKVTENNLKLQTNSNTGKNKCFFNKNNHLQINEQILNTIRNVALTNVNDFVKNSLPKVGDNKKLKEIINKSSLLGDDNKIILISNSMDNSKSIETIFDFNDVSCSSRSSYYGINIKELEQNVFKLLQEYFLSKIKEFQNQCKSNCVNYSNEQFLLSSLITHVKSEVSESIKSIECKHGLQAENNRKRAYFLMQKYLKLKMKRAHNDLNEMELYEYANDKDYAQMLFKVCELIEADFRHITSVCDCNKDDII